MAVANCMVVPPWSSTLFLTEPELVELLSQLCMPRQRTPNIGGYQLIVDGHLLWAISKKNSARPWRHVVGRVQIQIVADCIIITAAE